MEKTNRQLLLGLLVIVGVMCIVIIAGNHLSLMVEARTITVDDDGVAEYDNIQEAIDNVLSGDIIQVDDGLYEENIVIDIDVEIKSVNGSEKTTIKAADPDKHVIDVDADDILIQGVNITGANGEDWPLPAGIHVDAQNALVVEECILFRNYYALQCTDLTNARIEGNAIIFNEGWTAVNMQLGCNDNELIGNIIMQNADNAVYISNSCYRNVIKKNSISGHVKGMDNIALWLEHDATNNVIQDNEIFDNDKGIVLNDASNYNNFSRNLLRDMKKLIVSLDKMFGDEKGCRFNTFNDDRLWGPDGQRVVNLYLHEESTDNRFNRMTFGKDFPTKISYSCDGEFEISDVQLPPDDPPDKKNMSKYVNITSKSEFGSIEVKFHYLHKELERLAEQSLSVWRHDGSVWSEVDGSRVNTDKNIVSAKIEGKFSDFAPLGNETGPPVHNVDTGENFTNLQDAIDDPDTLAGHTIQVDAVTLYVNVIVNKSLTIEGSGKDETIIDGENNGPVVNITADWCNLSGFNITKGTTGIFIGSENVTVTLCTVTDNSAHGIQLESAVNVTLDNTTVELSDRNGIYLDASHYCNIINCTSNFNDGNGIFVRDSHDDTISSCNASYNKKNGIFIDPSEKQILIETRIIGNDGNGFEGLQVDFLHLENLVAEKNKKSGISLEKCDGISSWGLMLDGNEMWGMIVNDCQDVSVRDSEARRNGYDGFSFEMVYNALVERAQSTTNGWGAFYLFQCTETTIKDSEGSYNEWEGIFGYDLYDFLLSGNMFTGNGFSGGHFDILEKSSIENTVFNNSGKTGLYVNNSKNVTIVEVSAKDNAELGVEFIGVLDSLIDKATLTNNGKQGGSLRDCRNVEITESTINDNQGNGLDIVNSLLGKIKLTSIMRNGETGLNLFKSDNNRIESVTLGNNGNHEIVSTDSQGNVVTSSDISTGKRSVIIFLVSSVVTIEDSRIKSDSEKRGNSDTVYLHADKDSHGVTGTNVTFNSYPTSISFSLDHGVNLSGVDVAPSHPQRKNDIGKYLNATGLTLDSWLNITFHYNDSDVASADESSLKLHRYDGSSWHLVPDSGVDQSGNYVYANITEFSIFAPLWDSAGEVKVHNIDTGEDFETIQEAIDDPDTNDGHTIEVDPGSYTETVNVDKELTIRSKSGDPTDTTIASDDSDGAVFTLSANNITIQGFTVRDATEFNAGGIYLHQVEGCTVMNNVLTNNYYGISLNDGAHDNLIQQNSVIQNDDSGIVLRNSHGNTLSSNNASSNEFDGILLVLSESNHILTNILRNNGDSGMKLYDSHGNTVNLNIIESNGLGESGPDFCNGIYLKGSNDNIFTSNSESGNKNFEFYAREDCKRNTVNELELHSYPTTISFTFDHGIAVKSVLSAPPSPADVSPFDKYVHITNVTDESWIFLTVHYDDSDITGLDESTIRIWHYHEDWIEVMDSTVNIEDNDVSANLTEFSIFAPMGEHPSENIPPTITITSPANQSTVQGEISITGTANDGDGDETLQLVELSIDQGEWEAATGTTSWTFPWDTRTVVNVRYSIRARAFDGTDYSEIMEIFVNVQNIPPKNNPPVVTITSPANYTVVNGTLTISGTASDPDGDDNLQKVTVRLNGGSWMDAVGLSSWSFELDTLNLSNRDHWIEVGSHDQVSLSAIARLIVNVQNSVPQNVKPTIIITAPENMAEVWENVTIRGSASDEDGNVMRVELSIDGGDWIEVTGIVSWNFTWDSTQVEDGEYSIKVRAYDGMDYSDEIVLKVSVYNEDDGDGGGFIPGFGLVIYCVSIAFVTVLLFRKKR